MGFATRMRIAVKNGVDCIIAPPSGRESGVFWLPFLAKQKKTTVYWNRPTYAIDALTTKDFFSVACNLTKITSEADLNSQIHDEGVVLVPYYKS